MKRIAQYILFSFLLGCYALSAPEALAGEAATYIEQGNTAYTARQYDSALTYYEQAWALDSNSSLIHFNIGNTYYRLGELASSIWHYKMAEKMAPSDPDIQANLKLVESQRTDEIEAVPKNIGAQLGEHIESWFSYNIWLMLCIVFSIVAALCWGLFALGTTRPLKKAGFVTGIVFSLVFLLSLLTFNRAHHTFYDRDHAIVFEPTLNVANEPSDNASTLFVLHEGTEISVKEERNNWLRIRILDGSEGWVLENAVKRY